MTSGPGFAPVCGVFLGGAVGTALRYFADLAASDEVVVTFAINVLGAFLLGALTRFWAGRRAGGTGQLALGTGVLGGFTTYSALASYASQLLLAGQVWQAVGYAVGTLAAGTAAAFGGVALAAWAARK